MKRILTGIVAATLLATVVDAQSSRYFLQDLGTLPGATFSQASDMNDWGVVAGISATPEGTQHAVLWVAGRPVDIASRTRGGLNTGAFGINEWGQVSMQVETSTPDPNGEDFCGYGTHLTCRAARWQLGVLTRLRTLGGSNATAGNINNLGQIPGTAETKIVDASCSASQPSQVLQYRPVIWEPNPETIRSFRCSAAIRSASPRGSTTRGRPSGSPVRAATARCFRCRSGRKPCSGTRTGQSTTSATLARPR